MADASPTIDDSVLRAMVAEEIRPICDRLAGASARLRVLLAAARPDSRDYRGLLLDGFDPSRPRVIVGSGTDNGNRAPVTDHKALAFLEVARRLIALAEDDRAIDPTTGLPEVPERHIGMTAQGLITGMAINVQF